MADAEVRYQSPDEDSGRWSAFTFRPGDIVISTRSKSGTTWMQMICALLVFGTADLPAPLDELSPWLDWKVTPIDELVGRLDAQTHRRFVKTHTPLDGVPLVPDVSYVVVGRDPLDTAVSLFHHGANLDRRRLHELTGAPLPAGDRPPLDEWLRDWIAWDGDPRQQLDSLPGVLLHATDAWARRAQGQVVLTHYADLSANLEGEMRRLADELGFEVDQTAWPALVEGASFEAMRAQADRVAPGFPGVLKDTGRFFRAGRSGAGARQLSDPELAAYRERCAGLARADVLAWLQRP